MIVLNRILAVFRARLREFYRDKAGLGWNIVMPVLIIAAFAFIFSEEPEEVLTVGVLGDGDHPLLAVPQLREVRLDDRAAAIVKVERHQIDLLLDLSASPPSYWINRHSARGQVAERLLLAEAPGAKPDPDNVTMTTTTPSIARREVSGRDIRYVDWVMPGVLAMNLMFSCLWGVGWVIVRYRKNGVLRRLSATPLTPLEFLSAQVMTRLLIVTAVTVVVYVGAGLLVDFTMRGSHLALAVMFLAGAACLTSMGLIVATRLKNEELADGILNLLSWPMMIMSGVWFSLEGATPAAQAVAQLMPLTHLVDGARAIMIDGAGLVDVLPQFVILAATALALLLLAARLFRWQ